MRPWWRDWVLPQIEQCGSIRTWIVDDHGLSQEGQALDGRSASVLRPDGQAGQPLGCGQPIDRQLASLASDVSLTHLDGESGTTREG